MAEDAATAAGETANSAGSSSSSAAATDGAKGKRKGLLARMWGGIFRGRGEDYEKRLQYLSKEEAAVHLRMKRRAQGWRKMARNVILFSVVAEVAAVIYAVMTTRSLDLSWQMRALRVLPMFALPAVSFFIYTTLGGFTKMRDRKDQKTLERLRAERQAKIDELKEKTNYYTTQQLIQRYDLDPAAKAAAATILASKLGADSGLKVSLEDESKISSMPFGKSSDAELVPSAGLRNRRQAKTRSQISESGVTQQFGSNEMTEDVSPDGQEAVHQGQRYVEHYKGSGSVEGGWIARLAAMLVGEDPSQSYALICGNCHMHNGLARKEDFPYVTYYCPHCHALNGHKQPEEQGPSAALVSGNISVPAPDNGDIARTSSSNSSIVSEGDENPQKTAAATKEYHGEGNHDKQSTESN